MWGHLLLLPAVCWGTHQSTGDTSSTHSNLIIHSIIIAFVCSVMPSNYHVSYSISDNQSANTLSFKIKACDIDGCICCDHCFVTAKSEHTFVTCLTTGHICSMTSKFSPNLPVGTVIIYVTRTTILCHVQITNRARRAYSPLLTFKTAFCTSVQIFQILRKGQSQSL